jgi:hypothetical protein
LDVAQIVSERLGAEFELSEEIVDKRNYIVTTDKLKEIGVTPDKTINDAIVEIEEAFDRGLIRKYSDDEYSNYKSLFNSKELQRKIYSFGPIGERI